MRLSILVPVYNERAVVRSCLTKVLESPLPEGLEREIILVDDCSTDGSGEILEAFIASHPEIKLFRKLKNEGKGAAIRTALISWHIEPPVGQAALTCHPCWTSSLNSPCLKYVVCRNEARMKT